ncbi:MAG: hypothetical protein LUO93_07745 [Methanomicrobiales archaeon]|nr:hypothetical protein [Methanomicrobiales archaeon]
MNNYLNNYIEQLRKDFSGLPEELSHQIAFAFLTFRLGLYDDTICRCDRSLALLSASKSPPMLEKALKIVRQRAQDLSESKVQTTGLPEFTPEERAYLAIPLAPEEVEDPIHLSITNSLLLIYAVGRIASPQDIQALEEQERYVHQFLLAYRKQINLG